MTGQSTVVLGWHRIVEYQCCDKQLDKIAKLAKLLSSTATDIVSRSVMIMFITLRRATYSDIILKQQKKVTYHWAVEPIFPFYFLVSNDASAAYRWVRMPSCSPYPLSAATASYSNTKGSRCDDFCY